MNDCDTDNINDLKCGIEILNTRLDNSDCTGEYGVCAGNGSARDIFLVKENVSSGDRRMSKR